MSVTKGMIFLENASKIIEGAMTERLVENKRDQNGEFTVSDFDDVTYKLVTDGSVVTLHARIPNYSQLTQYGAEQVMGQEFPGMRVTAETGYDVGVTVDGDKLPMPKEDVVAKFSTLRNIVQGAPLRLAFEELATKRPDATPTRPLSRYDYRKSESVFVVPQKDRVLVVHSLDFGDDTDQAMARVFLQEFVEVQRSVGAAPLCSFSRTPPMELRELNIGIRRPVSKRGSPTSVEDGIAGYLSFALFPNHVSSEEKRVRATSMLLGFRSYLHYHIKASKTYLHMRMRLRVTNLLQVLNRAIPEVETEKKTMSGRTFKRSSS